MGMGAIRFILLIGSIFTLVFMLWRIRHAKVQIKDTLFWLVFALALLVLAIFPNIAIVLALWLGIESPINFVFLVIIFLLLLYSFTASVKLSQLDRKITVLAQKLAIVEKDKEDATSVHHQP